MKEIQLPRLRCFRCLYEWIPRKPVVPACPRCRSKLYAAPRIRPVKPGNGLGIEEVIGPKKRALLTAARRLGAVRVRVFGSVRRREAGPDSDVDLLVDWGSRRKPLASLLLAIAGRQLLGRRVDVASEETLSWSMRPFVLAEAVELKL